MYKTWVVSVLRLITHVNLYIIADSLRLNLDLDPLDPSFTLFTPFVGISMQPFNWNTWKM